jgi:aminoglycoside 6-adenylyltransferase
VDDEAMRAQLIGWGEAQPGVRAMLLTSTRAIPGAASDRLSDYDLILALREVRPFYDDRGWLEAFGRVLVMYRDPLQGEPGQESSANVVQFEGGLKIDFTFWPVARLRQIAAEPALPDELDAGYQVLLDKDGLCDGLLAPRYQAYIPKPPSESDYLKTLEEFWLDATYAAKYLWRDDLMAAKRLLDESMKQEYLRPMLEWLVELEHAWSVKPGPYGRGLKRRLRADLWAALAGTYAGAELEANWEALFATVALMRRAAMEAGARLGYVYPAEMEKRVLAHLRWVRALPAPTAPRNSKG